VFLTKYYPADQIKKNRLVRYVARMGDKIGTDRVGNPKGKSPLGRPRRRWKDNIKMDL